MMNIVSKEQKIHNELCSLMFLYDLHDVSLLRFYAETYGEIDEYIQYLNRIKSYIIDIIHSCDKLLCDITSSESTLIYKEDKVNKTDEEIFILSQIIEKAYRFSNIFVLCDIDTSTCIYSIHVIKSLMQQALEICISIIKGIQYEL